MSDWKDEAIGSFLTPIIEILAEEIDPEFSKLEFVAWLEDGVIGISYRAFDKSSKKIKLGPLDSINDRDDDLKQLTKGFRDAFVAHGENWVAMHVSVSADGDFDLQFDYDDPCKFDFRGASVR